jgi:hypothetical protein
MSNLAWSAKLNEKLNLEGPAYSDRSADTDSSTNLGGSANLEGLLKIIFNQKYPRRTS